MLKTASLASANPQSKAASQSAAIAAAEQAKLAKSDYDTYGGNSYTSDYSRPGKLHHKCTCICPAPYRKTYAVQQTYSQPQPSYVDSRSEAESDKHQLAALLQAMGASSQQKAAAMHQ